MERHLIRTAPSQRVAASRAASRADRNHIVERSLRKNHVFHCICKTRRVTRCPLLLQRPQNARGTQDDSTHGPHRQRASRYLHSTTGISDRVKGTSYCPAIGRALHSIANLPWDGPGATKCREQLLSSVASQGCRLLTVRNSAVLTVREVSQHLRHTHFPHT